MPTSKPPSPRAAKAKPSSLPPSPRAWPRAAKAKSTSPRAAKAKPSSLPPSPRAAKARSTSPRKKGKVASPRVAKAKPSSPRAVKAQRDAAATVAAQVRLGLQKGDLVEVRDSPAHSFRRGVVTQIRDDGRPLVRRYELDARSGQGFPFREVRRRPPPPAAASSEVRASLYDTS